MNINFDQIISLVSSENLSKIEVNDLLIRSIKDNKIDIFKKLFDATIERSDFNEIINYKGESPLIIEVTKSGHDGVLKNLIEHQIDLKMTDFNGNNAMHFAIKKGKMESFKILHDANPALILSTNRSEENILDIAAQKRSAHFIKRLAQIIGKENMVKLFSDQFGFHRFHILITDGDTEVVRTIFEICADVVGFSLVIKSSHQDFGSPIQAAIKAERIEVVKAFLDYYPNLATNISSDGKNNLHIAIETGSKEFVAEILRLYKEKSDEDQIRYLLQMRDSDGFSPIERSVINGTESILRLILPYSDIKSCNNEGNNLLHIAILLNHSNCCAEILKEKEITDLFLQKNGNNLTPIELAANKLCNENGNSAILENLVGSMIVGCEEVNEIKSDLLIQLVKDQLKIVVHNDVRVLSNVFRKNKHLPKMQEIYDIVKNDIEGSSNFELKMGGF